MDENRPDTRRRRYGLTDDQLAVIFDMREDGKSFKQIIAATVADDPAASGGAIIRALSPQPPKYVMKYLKSRKVKA